MSPVTSFELRKFSKLSKPAASDSAWIHYPERTELSLTFDVLDSTQVKLKVVWRYSIFDQVVFPRGGGQPAQETSLSVNQKYPYISFKLSDSHRVVQSRFQVSFHSKAEFERCLAYLESDLGIAVKQVSAPLVPSSKFKVGSGRGDAKAAELQRSQLSQLWGPSQASEASEAFQNTQDQMVYSQVAYSQQQQPHQQQSQQDYISYQSQLVMASQIPEFPDYQEVWETDAGAEHQSTRIDVTGMSAAGDVNTSATSVGNKTNVLADLQSALPDLQGVSNEQLKSMILETLESPEFATFCERIESLVKGNDPRGTKKGGKKGKPFECDECDRAYESKRGLQVHITKNHKRK